MPMPKPGSGESESDFMERCMGDEVMASEFPDSEQRAAVCHSQFGGKAEALAAPRPVEMRVVQENADGSGVVEIPILTIGTVNEWEITRETLTEIIGNFDTHAGPVPIGVSPHKDFEQTAGAMPGFIEKLTARGGTLYAQIFAVAPLFAELMAGMWRGFSIDGAKDAVWPTGKVDGWAVIGGVFTNRPAADVNFRAPQVPRSVAAEARVPVMLTRPAAKQELDMAEEKKTASAGAKAQASETVSREFHQSKLSEVKDELAANQSRVQQLEATLSGLRDEHAALKAEHSDTAAKFAASGDEKAAANARVNRLEAELKGVRDANRQLNVSLTETAEKLRESENANLSIKVTKIVEDAIERGVPPAIFDGFKDNPAEWMSGRYASLDAFESTVQSIAGVSKSLTTDPTRSGFDPSKAEDDSGDGVKLKDGERATLEERFPQGVRFQGVTNEAEARKRFEATKSKK